MRLGKIFSALIFAGIAAPCSAALYIPTSTILEAQTGKISWEGPDNYQDLGTSMGTHSADSTFSYLSQWSGDDITSSASSSADLLEDQILLSATTSSNGSGEDATQANASANVSFYFPMAGTMTFTESGSAVNPFQTTLSLTGPGGWSWSGATGQSAVAPAGQYNFMIDATVERAAGLDFGSNIAAGIKFAPIPAAVVPEPGMIWLLGGVSMLAMACGTQRKSRK